MLTCSRSFGRNVRPVVAVALGVVATALAAGPALATVTVKVLVKEGDLVTDIGNITSVDGIAVNNAGDWLVESDTNHANTDADTVLLRNGNLAFREGQALTEPTGSSISSFDSVGVNNNGNTFWNLFLDGLTTSTDSGIFFKELLIIQESTISTAPEFEPNTPYIGWFEVRANDNDQLALIASIDDPNIPSTVDRALVIVDYDVKNDTFTESALAKEGQVLAGQTESVTDFGTGPEQIAYNNANQLMYVADLTGPTSSDGVVYINNTLIAQEGTASPVSGRNYNSLSTSTPVDINNNGDWVLRCTLTGDTATDSVIIHNNSLVAQEGTAPPGITETISSFGTGPSARINDRNEVCWYAQWTGDAATNQGLFIDDSLLLRKGDLIEGQTLTTISGTTATGGITEGFDMSQNGRFIIVRAVLDTTDTVALLVDRCAYDIHPFGGGDFDVDIDDYSEVILNWGTAGPNGDTDGDGDVDIDDYSNIVLNWGDCD